MNTKDTDTNSVSLEEEQANSKEKIVLAVVLTAILIICIGILYLCTQNSFCSRASEYVLRVPFLMFEQLEKLGRLGC